MSVSLSVCMSVPSVTCEVGGSHSTRAKKSSFSNSLILDVRTDILLTRLTMTLAAD